MTRVVAISITFKIYGVFPSFIRSVLPLSNFPSIAILIPFVLSLPVIHSMNTRQNISSSILASSISLHSLDTIAGDAIPFRSGIYFLKKSMWLSHHFKLLRIESLPTRYPTTRHTSISTQSCFVFRPHRESMIIRM